MNRIKNLPGLIARFQAKVDASAGPAGCHLWTGATIPSGYGCLKVGFVDGSSRSVGAHRVALALATGLLPDGAVQALHSCDTPLCVNPDHLRWGDNAQNVGDRVARGRSARQPGRVNGRSVLTRRQVAAIRAVPEHRGVQAELAAAFGVSASTVSLIRSGKTWVGVG